MEAAADLGTRSATGAAARPLLVIVTDGRATDAPEGIDPLAGRLGGRNLTLAELAGTALEAAVRATISS